MKIQKLSECPQNSSFKADLVIIGGGPVGLTIARECAGRGRSVLVLESGVEQENPVHDALNRVETQGDPLSPAQMTKRGLYHRANTQLWSHHAQPYGVRCRALGGSTHGWAGKSAPFSPIDFARRDWLPHSGWPFSRQSVEPFVLRAMEVLNLCPNEPDRLFNKSPMESFYWQFSRSRVDRMDVMRFGREILYERPVDVHVVMDATVTHIALKADGSRFRSLSIASVEGITATVEAEICVLAASAIENARLLLVSRDVQPNGIGNGHDVVGRYLMDHTGCCVAKVCAEGVDIIARRFGFFGVGYNGRAHMFMHGLALSPRVQEEEKLLNAAIYFAPQFAPDDPWPAVKRIIQGRCKSLRQDLLTTLRGGGFLLRGIALQFLTHRRFPVTLRELIINTAIRLKPNLVAEEFVSQGVPHKLLGMAVEAISEQQPDPESRITLSSTVDCFGVPLAKVDWRIGAGERRTLQRIGKIAKAAFNEAGLPDLLLEDWVRADRPDEADIIDLAHTLGTTRMSADPANGVVDADCRVHGVEGLYIGGGSVFPTGGHANPTLMMLALAIRLADHLSGKFRQDGSVRAMWQDARSPANREECHANLG